MVILRKAAKDKLINFVDLRIIGLFLCVTFILVIQNVSGQK